MITQIALSGKCGAGKDVVGKYLLEKYDYKVVRFSHYIKKIVGECTNTSLNDNYYKKQKIPNYDINFPKYYEICSRITGHLSVLFEDNFINENQTKINDISNVISTKRGITLGTYQQIIGVYFRENFDKNIWIKFFWNDIKEFEKVVVVDVRFKNEVKFLKDKAFTIIRINRFKKLRTNSLCGRDENHISEVDLDNYSFKNVIDNNYTKKELYKKVEQIIRPLENEVLSGYGYLAKMIFKLFFYVIAGLFLAMYVIRFYL
jgi:dephospho-CoA kinase